MSYHTQLASDNIALAMYNYKTQSVSNIITC